MRRPLTAMLNSSPDDVEAQFYEALQTADLRKLLALWADDDEIVCVHPGGSRVVGPAQIAQSFEQIFSQGSVPAVPEQVHRLHTPGTAVHHLLERLSIPTAEGLRTAWIYATNVYVKTAQGWRMVAHHASAAPEPPKTETQPSVPPVTPTSTLH
jgi:uncharacterized protein (TIGR02246 family)